MYKNYEYKFEKIEVVSDMDELGQEQMMVIERANINKVEGIKPFLEELNGSCGATNVSCKSTIPIQINQE